jgi:hypothetical protein
MIIEKDFPDEKIIFKKMILFFSQPSRSYICICPKGFTGRTCDISLSTSKTHGNKYVLDTQPTTPMPQKIDLDEPTTSTGPVSTVAKHPCLTERCQNNGSCVMAFSHAKNKFSFVCKCQPGFVGEMCETRENPCLPNPCKKPASECIPLGYNKYECVCENGDCLTSTTTATTKLPSTAKVTNKPAVLTEEKVVKKPKLFKKNRKNKKTNTTTNTFLINNNSNPCNNDPNLCLKYPYGNESFICVKSFVTQDYTLCLPTKSMSCKESNPCLNGGVCMENKNG